MNISVKCADDQYKCTSSLYIYTPAPKEKGGVLFYLLMSVSVCPSVCLSVHNKNICRIFLGNYSADMLEILTQSLFRHAIWWDLILYESDVNFLINVDNVYFLHKFSYEFSSKRRFIADA